MGKNVVWFVFIIVVGALLGSFLGNLLGLMMPPGQVRNLFIQEVSAGLSPATLDLRIVVLTFGCVFRINFMAILGIIVAAIIFKKIAK